MHLQLSHDSRERDSVKGFHNLSHMVAHPPRSAERLATHNVDPVGTVTAVSTMSDLQFRPRVTFKLCINKEMFTIFLELDKRSYTICYISYI